jgi:SAM-dependent methyltransferase
MSNTSWQNVAGWYQKSVGKKGLYFHTEVIIPNILKIINNHSAKVLDIACGQGVLSRNLGARASYLGVDISLDLVDFARQNNTFRKHEFLVSDVSNPFDSENDFDFATIILALQNIRNHKGVFKNVFQKLKPGGKFIIVLNHPYYRIPQQTEWYIDYDRQEHFRLVQGYMKPREIEIDMTPGEKDFQKKKFTISLHRPLSVLINDLVSEGFNITGMHEWVSNKKSEGKAARMENEAREEIPMFMGLVGEKRK